MACAHFRRCCKKNSILKLSFWRSVKSKSQVQAPHNPPRCYQGIAYGMLLIMQNKPKSLIFTCEQLESPLHHKSLFTGSSSIKFSGSSGWKLNMHRRILFDDIYEHKPHFHCMVRLDSTILALFQFSIVGSV